MKNFIFKTLFLVLFVFLAGTLTACKSQDVPIPKQITTIKDVIVTETIRDTVFIIKPDNSYYKAWLECKDGKVILKPKSIPENKPGNYLKPPKVKIIDNVLEVDCDTEAQRLFAQWKDTYKLENISTENLIPYEVVKPLTFLQKFQIWCGRIFLMLVLATGVGFVLKWKRII